MPAARSRSVADRGVPKPRSDAYVGLLGLSLLALTAAMVFAFLNYNGLSSEKPKQVQAAPRGGAPAGGPAPAVPPAAPPAGPGQPGVPPAPGQQPPAGRQPPAGQQPGVPQPAPGKQPAAPQPK